MTPGVAAQDEAPPPFQMEGLWQALSRLDRMLERAATAADAASASGSGTVEPYRGLYITAEDVHRLVARNPGEPLLAGGEAGQVTAMPAGSRFPWLQHTFKLDMIELDILLIALAPETDLRYERLFAYLQDDVTRRRPTVDLALNLLCATREAKIAARGRFAPDAPLVRHKLLQLLPDGTGPQPPLLAHVMKLDDAVVRLLLGQTGLDQRLHAFARLETPVASGRAIDGRAADQAMARAIESGVRPHFYLEGPASGEKHSAAERLSASLGAPILTVDLDKAPAASGEFDAALDSIFREAQLVHAVVYLDDLDVLAAPDRVSAAQALQSWLDEFNGVVIAAGERPCALRFQTVTSLPIAAPDFHERRAIWASALLGEGMSVDPQMIDELAARYGLSDRQIRQAVATTARQAAVQGSVPGPKDLAKASRLQAQRDPGTLARKIAPIYVWNDLVLPDDQVAQLKELCRQARHKHTVYGDWGFDRKLSLGKGLSALFSGPPGTGKTMAVEVIANDLGLDVYKTDLSQVVSKYIGETEKNLDRLFTEARAGNAILFFDECDALFGKRTTVQDAHDRYANIEISYLLQKLDEHDGLSILASNLRQNLDAAFTRRLTFIVEFPFPDEDSRRRIWRVDLAGRGPAEQGRGPRVHGDQLQAGGRRGQEHRRRGGVPRGRGQDRDHDRALDLGNAARAREIGAPRGAVGARSL